jgi:hypothetical protein
MEQYALDQLKTIAKVSTTCKRLEMTRRERLERWAESLECSPRPFLKTLHETEYQPMADRLALRDDGTPISVAFADPILRAAGMETTAMERPNGSSNSATGNRRALSASAILVNASARQSLLAVCERWQVANQVGFSLSFVRPWPIEAKGHLAL